MIDQRTRLGSAGQIEDDALVPYLQQQRWYGAHTRDVHGAGVVDSVPLVDDASLRISLVELHFDAGTHDLYQLLVREDDGDIFEGTDDPALATRLVELVATRATVAGADGNVTFDAIRPVTPPGEPMARVLGGEASNSVVIVDDL